MSVKPTPIRGILKRLGLEFKDRMEVSKLNLGALMRPNFPLKIRVWACIQIHSCGYDQQLAVTQVKAEIKGERKIVPITPGGIAGTLNKATLQAFADAGSALTEEFRTALKIRKQHVSRALNELEDDGFIDRFVANCQPHKLIDLTMEEAHSRGLGSRLSDLPLGARKRCPGGRVFVYSLAQPRAPKTIDLDACLELANRRLDVTKNGYVDDHNSNPFNKYFQESFDFMKDAELRKRANKAFDVAPDRARLIMDELAKSLHALKDQAMQQLAEIAEQPAATPSSTPAPAATQEPLFTPPPAPVEPQLVSHPRQRVSDPEAYEVLEKMQQYGAADLDGARHLISRCRRASTSAVTVAQVLQAIDLKGNAARRKDSPVGYFMTYVPPMFEVAHQPSTRRRGSEVPAEVNRAQNILDNQEVFLPEDIEWANNILKKAAQSEPGAPASAAFGD